LTEDLEQQLGAARRQRDIAQLVDDQEGSRSWLGVPPPLSIGDTIGAGLAARALAGSEFRNGSQLKGYLSIESKLDRQKAAKIAARWRVIHGGADRGFKTPVLEMGLEYKEITVRDLANLQLAELTRLNGNDVCTAFNVPPSSVSLVEKQQRSTIEDERRLVSLCLSPLAARVGDAVGLLMLSPEQRSAGLRVAINLESLVRGYGLELSEALGRYVLAGVLTRNEVRRAIGYPGRADTEEPLIPVNEETISAMESRNGRADAESAAKVDTAQQPAVAGLSAVDAYVLPEFAQDLRIAEGTEPANDQAAASSDTKLAQPKAAE
jgi:hypothetical protein